MKTVSLLGLLITNASLTQGAELLIESSFAFDLPGYVSYTLSIEPADGEDLRGIETSFTGPMSQVTPFSREILTWPYAPPCWNCDPIINQDSHLLFDPNGPVGGEPFLLIGQESDESLSVDVAGLQFFDFPPGPTPFAQIVAPRNATVDYEIGFDLGTGDLVPFNGSLETLFGDFEPDGDVDIIDFGLFADAYDSLQGDANYDIRADSEPDGDVDIIDFGGYATTFRASMTAAAIPEPTAALAAFTGLLAAAVAQRR